MPNPETTPADLRHLANMLANLGAAARHVGCTPAVVHRLDMLREQLAGEHAQAIMHARYVARLVDNGSQVADGSQADSQPTP